MAKEQPRALKDFYADQDGQSFATAGETAHFNIFDVSETLQRYRTDKIMPYNRRTYYKISLIQGKNMVEYADRVIKVSTNALLFATPKIPYRWVPEAPDQSGYFCVFTAGFMSPRQTGLLLDTLPIFAPGAYPVFEISDQEVPGIQRIFTHMQQELASSYAYKYDLIRAYLMELILLGQKLHPAPPLASHQNAAERITLLFIELLERQFPLMDVHQQMELTSPKDYADRLSIHVNYLNKALKETRGQTTSSMIATRILEEAKILLKHTTRNISEIAWCLGFDEVAHFSNFFKKYTQLSPQQFRTA